MGTVQSPKEFNVYEDNSHCIVDERQQQKKKKRYEKTKGRIRKAGFDPDEMSKDKMIEMQPLFKEIAAEQLRLTRVGPFDRTEENCENFVKLPYMEKFEDLLKLDDKVWKAMKHYDLMEPTPIQKVAIPYIAEFKNDLIVKAQTGSGKTFAFLLPIIDKIIEIKKQEQHTNKNSTSPYAVVVAPVAELTWQLACDATRLIHDLYNVRVAFAFGGLDMRESKRMLDNGCDLLFVPPGRLYHYFFEQQEHKAPLLDTKNIKFVVLDEADRLLAYKRTNQQNKDAPTSSSSDEQEEPLEGELNVDNFRRILHDFIVKKLADHDFHVFMFSATLKYEMYRPFVVTDKCLTISVGDDHPTMTVKQSFLEIKYEHEKIDMLYGLLEVISDQLEENKKKPEGSLRRIGKTLVFVNNIRQGERIAHGLLTQGYNVASINSNRSIRQRLQVISDMLSDVIDIVVATDVLSRGINIPRVDYVINYDFPYKFSSYEYVHRVGRCGRIGNIGNSFTFFDPKKDHASAPHLIAGCEATGQEVPEVLQRCVRLPSPPQYHNFGFDQQNVIKNSSRYPPKFFNNSIVNQRNQQNASPQQQYEENRQRHNSGQENYYRHQNWNHSPAQHQNYNNRQGPEQGNYYQNNRRQNWNHSPSQQQNYYNKNGWQSDPIHNNNVFASVN